MKKLVANGEDLKVVGIVQPDADAKATALQAGIAYPYALTEHVAEEAKKSEIVKQQLKNRISMYLQMKNSNRQR